jgi:hypothetical protein
VADASATVGAPAAGVSDELAIVAAGAGKAALAGTPIAAVRGNSRDATDSHPLAGSVQASISKARRQRM